MGKAHKALPYTKNYRQIGNVERGENVVLVEVYQLVTQYQMGSHGNMHTVTVYRMIRKYIGKHMHIHSCMQQ